MALILFCLHIFTFPSIYFNEALVIAKKYRFCTFSLFLFFFYEALAIAKKYSFCTFSFIHSLICQTFVLVQIHSFYVVCLFLFKHLHQHKYSFENGDVLFIRLKVYEVIFVFVSVFLILILTNFSTCPAFQQAHPMTNSLLMLAYKKLLKVSIG